MPYTSAARDQNLRRVSNQSFSFTVEQGREDPLEAPILKHAVRYCLYRIVWYGLQARHAIAALNVVVLVSKERLYGSSSVNSSASAR